MTRKPQAFDLSAQDKPALVEQKDPFSETAILETMAAPVTVTKHRSGLLAFAMSMFSGFMLLALGNWAWRIISDLMAQNIWFGYAGIAFLSLAVLAGLIWLGRELLAMRHLARLDALRAMAQEAHETRDSALAVKSVQQLAAIYAGIGEQARGRAEIESTFNDIIDADDRIAMAERALLRPLDERARAIIAESAKRVSVVTAVSPRALVDILFVGAETLRLIRRLSMLYGGRPGFFGSVRLMRAVFAQFLVTGGLAVGDDLAGQFLGHGVAARLSAKLGEGVLNGLLTARVGLASIDACRPFPFIGEERPKVREVAGSLLENIGKNPFA